MSRQGRHGESLFTTACTAPEAVAEATVNTSESDEHGWDHVVEIETTETARLPADLRSHLLTCFAQIKTTSTKTPKTVVKLSNAIKAVKSPAPSFVFLYHFADGHEPVLYGRHLWEEDIARILKRAREAGDAPLHKKRITFSFGEADRIETAPPDWILDVLGGRDGMAYAEEKRQLVDSVGYGEDRTRGTMSIGPVPSADDIVRHEIGLTEDLPFRDLRMFDRRFDIEVEDPRLSMVEGRISMSREGRPVMLRLRSVHGQEALLRGEGWAPISVGPDHEAFRFRIKTGAIEIVYSRSGDETIGLEYDAASPMPLVDLFGLCALLGFSHYGAVRISAEIDEGELMWGSANLDHPDSEWFVHAHACAEFVRSVLDERRRDETMMSMMDFSNAVRDLHPLAILHDATILGIEGKFVPAPPAFDAVAGFGVARFGEWVLETVREYQVLGREDADGRTVIRLGGMRTIFADASRRAEHDVRRRASERVREHARTAGRKIAFIGDGDLVSWVKRADEEADIAFHLEG